MPKILLRGGGDLASGVAFRLVKAGYPVLIAELAQPLVVRRAVSFAEAIFEGVQTVEGVTARKIINLDEVGAVVDAGEVPIIIDPDLKSLTQLKPLVLIDARMTKRHASLGVEVAELVIGLGPGFNVGENCHAVIETMRGANLGRVNWQGSALPDTGIPEAVLKRQGERVLRAPKDGELHSDVQIGASLQEGDLIATVGGEEVRAPFSGVLRGLIRPGLQVKAGMKIGDLDPRNDPEIAFRISDKALAVGGGVLQAVTERPDIRQELWR